MIACVVPISIGTNADAWRRRGILCELPASTWTARSGSSSFPGVFSHSLEYVPKISVASLSLMAQISVSVSWSWHRLLSAHQWCDIVLYMAYALTKERCPCHFCLIADSVPHKSCKVFVGVDQRATDAWIWPWKAASDARFGPCSEALWPDWICSRNIFPITW